MTKSHRTTWLTALAVLPALLTILLSAANPQAPQPTARPTSLTDAEIVQRIDSAVESRARAIAGYTVQEQYDLYRGTDSTPSAQETVQTTYSRTTGKSYNPTAQTGSALLRGAVIDKVLAGEKELNLPENREAPWLTSKNYEMQPEAATVQINGRQAIVVDLKPRRKSPHLFNGKLWIDPATYTVIRLEGSPSESPSIFAGTTTVTRDYILIDGYSMATHAEAHSHSGLFGDTILKIDYTNYKVQIEPSPASTPVASNTACPSTPPTAIV